MILTLIKLGIKFDNIREQIITGSTIPTFDDIFAQLLCHLSTMTWSRPSEVSNETSVMLAPSHSRGDSRSIHGGQQGRGQRPHCTYCNRPGHIRDRRYLLHGRPPCIAHVAQSSEPPPLPSQDQPLSPSQGVTFTPGEYEKFLRLSHATKSASIASVAQIGNASAYLAHSLGPWILDSGASDHLSDNKDLFSSLTITSPLSKITLANGTQIMAKGIRYACPLPSLPLTYVFYVPNSPFNLISISKLIYDLNCLITFSHSSVTLQYRSTKRTIGIGHESQGLYHLSSTPSSTIRASTDEPLLVHRRFNHPNISKLRKMGSHFSSLFSLECESCQLRKHTCVSFHKRLESRTKSPFELVYTDVWGPS